MIERVSGRRARWSFANSDADHSLGDVFTLRAPAQAVPSQPPRYDTMRGQGFRGGVPAVARRPPVSPAARLRQPAGSRATHEVERSQELGGRRAVEKGRGKFRQGDVFLRAQRRRDCRSREEALGDDFARRRPELGSTRAA